MTAPRLTWLDDFFGAINIEAGKNVSVTPIAGGVQIGACENLLAATSGDTDTVLATYPIADGEIKSLRWIVTVRSSDNSGDILAEWEIKSCFIRVGGTVSEAYATVVTKTFATMVAPTDPFLDWPDNTDVLLYVTGLSAIELTWSVAEFNL